MGNEQVPVLILSGSRCITKNVLADWSFCKAAEKGLKIVVVGQNHLQWIIMAFF